MQFDQTILAGPLMQPVHVLGYYGLKAARLL
jgi:hypothetical protein